MAAKPPNPTTKPMMIAAIRKVAWALLVGCPRMKKITPGKKARVRQIDSRCSNGLVVLWSSSPEHFQQVSNWSAIGSWHFGQVHMAQQHVSGEGYVKWGKGNR